MPMLTRPDGVEIHWDEQGEGPVVLMAHQFMGYPGIFEGLMADLATDHRVVVYDLRGNGASTRRGPYDFETDTADLEAVAEAAGGPVLLLAIADGCNRAVRLAARRPELVSAVVVGGGAPIPRSALRGSEGLVASDSVIDLALDQFRNDYRGALRMLVASNNPQASEDEIRDRVAFTVEYAPQEAALARLLAWAEDDPHQEGLAIGDRLWLLGGDGNPWFPTELQDTVRELLPDAHLERLGEGAISRPDLTAALIRGIALQTDAKARTA